MTALPGIALADWRSAGQTFSFNGHDIRYWTAGQGEPLLLIHGFPTASWDWHYLWAALAERYQVIACDMLGFGDSAKPRGHAYSLLEQADLQQALLAHLGVAEPVHILAHDYGDSVAQELLARHHEGRIRLARQLEIPLQAVNFPGHLLLRVRRELSRTLSFPEKKAMREMIRATVLGEEGAGQRAPVSSDS